jgi:hypothetical protein
VALDGGPAVCTIDRRAVGFTSVQAFPSALPPQYQYWPSDATRGGELWVQDYCPAVTAFSNRVCANPGSSYSSAKYFGQAFKPGAMCFDTTLVWSGVR